MECPRAAVFDLDDTLAESFKPPSVETLAALRQLLDAIPVAIMTGAGFPRMQAQFLPALANAPHIGRFYLFPTSASQCYVCNGGTWQQIYNVKLSPEERERIKDAVLKVVDSSEMFRGIPHYGEQMIDREAQVAYTLVGIEAPADVKRDWDPDGSKRRQLRDALQKTIPEFEILLGGTTTVDITKKGINKTYGIRWLSEHLNVPPEEMLYVGDAFFEGGNDAIVTSTGIKTRAVSGPQETLRILNELNDVCAA